MNLPASNPYASTARSGTAAKPKQPSSSVLRAIASVIVLTWILVFVAYLFVGFIAESVLIFVFARPEPLSIIIPHSDLGMVGLAALMCGAMLDRFEQISQTPFAIPVGTLIAWTLAMQATPAPWYVKLLAGISFGFVTMLGYRIVRICSQLRAPEIVEDAR